MQQGLLASCARRKEPALESAASTDRHQADSGVSDIAAAGEMGELTHAGNPGRDASSNA